MQGLSVLLISFKFKLNSIRNLEIKTTKSIMIHHIFDMSTASISEVRVVVRFMAKMGLSMGITILLTKRIKRPMLAQPLILQSTRQLLSLERH